MIRSASEDAIWNLQLAKRGFLASTGDPLRLRVGGGMHEPGVVTAYVLY